MIESPISDLKLEALGVDREAMLERIVYAISFAVEQGVHVAFFGVDGTRADPAYFETVYKTAVEAGAQEVVVVDTLGIAGPEAVADLVGRTHEWLGPDVPVHFHGHNDFGLATAAAVAAVRAGARWIQGTINGMGERAGNANLPEIALALRGLYGVETNLRLDRVRAFSERLRELSGYELEPYKPLVGDNLFTPRVRGRREPVPRPAGDRAVLVGRRRRGAADRARQEERHRLDPDQGRGARPRPRRRDASASCSSASRSSARRSAASSPTTSSGARRVADHDAVVVGSGINSLACAALLARAGWDVCVLEREGELGGAIKTAELTEPGFHHDVFSAWHPLWVGGPAHAELGDELAARGLEYLNTEHPTGDGVSRRSSALPRDEHRRRTPRSSSGTPRVTATPGARRWPASARRRSSSSACSARSSGRAPAPGLAPQGLPPARAARPRRLRRRGRAVEPRLARDDVRVGARRTGCSRPGFLHTGLGPDAAASGFMTRVIAFAIEAGGMPVPRGGGARLVDALVRLIEDHGGVCRTGADVERVLVRERASARGPPRRAATSSAAPRAVDLQRDADPALRTPARRRRRLCGRSQGGVDGSVSAARRCRSTSRSPSRRAGTGTSVSAETADRPRHARARRRLARGQRGRAGSAPGGGDDRRRPAADDGRSRAPRGPGLLWIQLQELPWHVKGDAAGELDVGDGAGRSRCASATPTGSRHGSRGTSRTSSRRCVRRVVLSPGRSAGGERQPRAGRSVLGLARARPELPLASVRAAARPPHAGRGPLPHRREHLAGARARRRLRDARRAGAAAAAGGERLARRFSGSRARASVGFPASGRVSRSRRSRPWRRRSRTTSARTRRGRRRHRHLGDQAARGRRRGSARGARGSSGLGRRVGGSRDPVDPAAAADGRPGRSRRAVDAICALAAPAGAVRAERRSSASPGRATTATRSSTVCSTIGDEAARAGVTGRARADQPGRRRRLDDHQVAAARRSSCSRTPTGPRSGSSSTRGTSGTRRRSSTDIERHADRFVGVHVADWREPTRRLGRPRPARRRRRRPARDPRRARPRRLGRLLRPRDLLGQRHASGTRGRTPSGIVPADELVARGQGGFRARLGGANPNPC